MRQFSKSFQNWTCTKDERIQISHIETYGNDIEEMLENAQVSFEDWHGNCTREGWIIDDLAQNDIDEVVRLFAIHLNGGSIRDGELNF